MRRPLYPLLVCALVAIAGGLAGASLEMYWNGNGNDARIPSIIGKWSPVAAMVACNFLNADGSYRQQVGSGILVEHPDGSADVLTSRHALFDQGQTPISCTADFPNGASFSIAPADISDATDTIDVGLLHLDASAAVRNLARGEMHVCASARVGDEVVLLSYPFAATTGLIATEGIIAGTDEEDRYLTSAATEEPSAGGAVIDVNGDCYLGMASSITLGNGASLSEIWKWQEFSGVVQGRL